ncbi:MAG: SDR family oxidoreductase [Bacteroidetes bacterium]|nr:SDR family oxidoreductase [Bacteroidota bacterium]
MEKRKVLITGASKGLGLAIAKKLVAEYTLVLHASRPESFTEPIPGAHILCADLSDGAQLTGFCKKLKSDHAEDLYAVVNNAGVTYDKPLLYQPEREIDAMLNINLKAPVMICKTVMKIFTQKKHGVIINMSSCVGESGNAFQAVYAATKAGLIALSKSLAREASAISKENHIRVLSVSPGFVETGMTASIPETEKQKYLGMIPSNRFGTVDDVAETIAFLLSDKASYINGSNIQVNGGLL